MNNNATCMLFVNTDGVLTSAGNYWLKDSRKSSKASAMLNPLAIRLLAQFCEEMGANVVMATAWEGFMPKPEQWRDCFREVAGVEVPVVGLLSSDYDGNKSWAAKMDDYMRGYQGWPYVLLEDDPAPENNPRVINVNAQTGLTTVDLQAAAEMLAPGCDVAKELASLNKSFSPDKRMTIAFGGQAVSVHPRDMGKAFDQLGLTKSDGNTAQ